MKRVIVVGAGLAGSEAAWQAANFGADVTLYEMRPARSSPAHKTEFFAELVCSNSLRGASLANAVGVLKEEMRRLGSLITEAADLTRVPAGGALAVDRKIFSRTVTEKILRHEKITVVREELKKIPRDDDAVIVVATGPLTDGEFAADIARMTGGDSFYFYDAAAPIVTKESVDTASAYLASRYDKGEAAYINCPMTKEEYEIFWCELTNAETAPVKNFEKEIFFEGCMPVEVMAKRGIDTLLFGPLKPVGLIDPKTGETPYAVVQLRQDNASGTLYNIVGFQTHLKHGEQKRVFSLIPALKNAEFVRFGVMHRNTFINSPRHLLPTLEFRGEANLFFAGQMTGVEGYVESAASGLVAGINAARCAAGKTPLVFPAETCHGALTNYITTADEKNFQPMNVNFGLLPPLAKKIRGKQQKKEMLAERALASLDEFRKNFREVFICG